jgi:hypothetical protein
MPSVTPQSLFHQVAVDSTNITANTATTTLTLTAGANVTLTPNNTAKSITITAKGTAEDVAAATIGVPQDLDRFLYSVLDTGDLKRFQLTDLKTLIRTALAEFFWEIPPAGENHPDALVYDDDFLTYDTDELIYS